MNLHTHSGPYYYKLFQQGLIWFCMLAFEDLATSVVVFAKLRAIPPTLVDDPDEMILL